MGQATDHRTGDAQVGQVAVGQRVQFTRRLVINRTAGTAFLHVLDRGHQSTGNASAGGGVVGVGDSSYGMSLSRVSALRHLCLARMAWRLLMYPRWR